MKVLIELDEETFEKLMKSLRYLCAFTKIAQLPEQFHNASSVLEIIEQQILNKKITRLME